jgi:hypothetical protein
MERTPTTQPAPRRRNRRLLAGCVGFILLTNLLTIVFVFMLRRNASAPAPVILQRVQPAAREAAEPAAHARIETRPVRVTSRPEGAVVTYQGQAQGTTPLSVALPAHAGAALAIEKDGYRARAVTVEPGQAKVHVRLARARERPAGRNAGRPAPVPAQAPAQDQADQPPVSDQAGQGEAGQGEAGQGDAPATEEPAARTPAVRKPARSSARRPPAADNPDSSTGGARGRAPASPDPSGE